ncbi:MAG: hypothetical protein MUE51_02340 [Thermoleophilia bacterium]|nr:hypothetical protein [Thermoleophilia bacterium]
MANHLTPEELSEATGIRRDELVRMCMQEAVPIYNGRIDKTLFVHSMLAAGHPLSDEARALVAT